MHSFTGVKSRKKNNEKYLLNILRIKPKFSFITAKDKT